MSRQTEPTEEIIVRLNYRDIQQLQDRYGDRYREAIRDIVHIHVVEKESDKRGSVTDNTYNPTALHICLFCDLVWTALCFAVCTYLVFWMNNSGWWFLLAILLAGCWNCKSYRSPEQIAASAKAKDEEEDE